MLVAISVETVIVVIADLLPFANTGTDHECAYTPWPSWSITVIVVTVLLPIVFLTLTYAWVWLIAFRVADDQCSRKCDERTSLKNKISARVCKIIELRATKTATLLVGVFVLCWGPIAVYYMVENLCDNCITMLFDKDAQNVVSFSVKVFSFISSILSPFVYCWRTREFQREFKKNLTRRHWRAARIALNFMQLAAKGKGERSSAAMAAKNDSSCKDGSVQGLHDPIPDPVCNENKEESDENENALMPASDTYLKDPYAPRFESQICIGLAEINDGIQTTTL